MKELVAGKLLLTAVDCDKGIPNLLPSQAANLLPNWTMLGKTPLPDQFQLHQLERRPAASSVGCWFLGLFRQLGFVTPRNGMVDLGGVEFSVKEIANPTSLAINADCADHHGLRDCQNCRALECASRGFPAPP